MKDARVFAPGHLTGLFQICDQHDDPVMKGARGSGVSLTRGVTTSVQTTPADETTYTITINDILRKDAIISENVLNKYLSKLDESIKINIQHSIDTPVTAGFGSSGSGAISLSLALNEALDAELTRIEAAQIAHVAEIECGTGLGSVYAANIGGFGAIVKPGAPGIGESISYNRSDELRVIYLYFGPIPTKEALADPELRRKINELGGNYVDELYPKFTPERFLRFSRKFTEHVGLVTPKLRKVFNQMDREGVTFTMAMFGEVAFTVQSVEQVDEVLKVLEGKGFGSVPTVCSIDTKGAMLL
ncbi:MAG: hypothetical protein NWE89_13585 [Candidatus Bathyarchaeota archaeon]|nr:hypothetical protein [Candidatus Bathyarchaeota archaeon]